MNILEHPTYVCVRRYPDGEIVMDETKAGTTLLQAMGNDIDNLVQVLLIEDGKVVDQTAHAAEIFWQHHGHEYESTFDVEQFLHDNISNVVYSDISERNYNARCDREHLMTLGPR